MASAQFVFCLACLILGTMVQEFNLTSASSVHQDSRFISAHVGDKVNLHCFYEGDDSAWICWYKQTLGQRPKLIASVFVYSTRTIFYDEFKNNPRFSLARENQRSQLTISDLKVSDSATYYCVLNYAQVVTFAEGTAVSVTDSSSNIQALVHQTASGTIHPGGSVTLNCTVQTGSCDGEHSVYWFRNSEDSHPGLIYSHGGRNDQCERNSNAHTCVFNLPMKNLNVSHAGTYYCALVSCGQILFGNGTKLDLNYEDIYFWGGSFAFIFILTVLLAVSVCLMIKNSSKSPGSWHFFKNLYCAASGVLTNRSLRQKDPTWSECVYYCKKKK
uniref:Uncharacterized LOC108244251 n=1 Tax=Kryptolebias marmoratus TaxID=37003 RepID=A0A3Q3B1F6_KRYMA